MRYTLVAAALVCWAGAELPQVTFTTIAQGAASQIEEPRTVAVRTAAEWQALLREHGGGRMADVDFARSTVLAVFLGSRPTAGYTVDITRIEKEEDALVVTWRERAPNPGDLVAQMLTSPFVIVRTDAHPGPVRFTRAK
jgi:hypothetical protein